MNSSDLYPVGRRLLVVPSMPQLQHQYRPHCVAVIGGIDLIERSDSRQKIRPEIASLPCLRLIENCRQRLYFSISLSPIPDRNPKTMLLLAKNLVRQNPGHSLLEY